MYLIRSVAKADLWLTKLYYYHIGPVSMKAAFVAYELQRGPTCIHVIVQALISIQALVFDLAQIICQKRFDCRSAILGVFYNTPRYVDS